MSIFFWFRFRSVFFGYELVWIHNLNSRKIHIIFKYIVNLGRFVVDPGKIHIIFRYIVDPGRFGYLGLQVPVNLKIYETQKVHENQ